MTPLLRLLSRLLSAPAVIPALTVLYAMLLLAILWRLGGKTDTIPYLDLGRSTVQTYTTE